MRHLSNELIHKLVSAACSARLSPASLVAGLTDGVRSRLPDMSRPPKDWLLTSIDELNGFSPREGEPPLVTFLKNARYLSEDQFESRIFDTALTVLRTTPTQKDQYALYVERVKEWYTSCGYRVTPNGANNHTFWASRSASVLSFIAVSVEDSVDLAIQLARDAREQVRRNEESIEAWVVLIADDPFHGARNDDEALQKMASQKEQVLRAGLLPVEYCDLRLRASAINDLVDQQYASMIANPHPTRDGDMTLEQGLPVFLSQSEARVFLIGARSQEQAYALRDRVIEWATKSFNDGMGEPAPLSLSLREGSLRELAGEVFFRHGVRHSPIGLPRWLEEGALLPIFTADCREDTRGGDLRAVKEAIDDKSTSKVVLIGRGLDAEGLKRRLRAPVMCASKIA